MTNRKRHRKQSHLPISQAQAQAAQSILDQFKRTAMKMLNDTSDEFDAKELTDDQRQVYNDFSGDFGEKILAMSFTFEKPNKEKQDA